jgi:ribosomal protein S18 acetylase RimI-like enzyme
LDGVVPLDPQSAAQLHDAARLYLALLPNTMLAALGQGFLRRFYFGTLVQEGTIRCDLYYYQGTPAGFISYSEEGFGFASTSIQRHWFRLGLLLTWSILSNPIRLKSILQMMLLMVRRRHAPPSPCKAEFLSFGVLPEFRSREFIRRTGRRVSAELFDSARQRFAELGVPTFRLIVEADNREAVFFYRAMGCAIDKISFGANKILQATYKFPEKQANG